MTPDPARNRALQRDVNQRIRDTSLSFPLAPSYEIHCECAGADCADRVRVPGVVYDRVLAEHGGFVVAHGHELRDELVLCAGSRFSVVA
jgi:hypothetical protein